MTNSEPLIDAARGDVGLSRYLKDTLRLLASNTKDPDLQRQIQEITAGRASLHTLMQSHTFTTIIDEALPAASQEAAARSEDELQRLAAEGEAVLERYRNQTPGAEADSVSRHPEPPAETPPRLATASSRVIPGTRRPNRDLVVAPNDLDDEDEYFQERRERGWLQ